ncbi:MAG: membrane protein insertase YidC [Chitinophagales bacterium]|nr:membrane protein insertase YidC [Chitinophagales bacterium]
MDRNTLTGLVLIVLLWIGMMFYNQNQQKKYEKEHPELVQKDSVVHNNKPQPQEVATNTVDTTATTIVVDTTKNKQFGQFSTFLSGQNQDVRIENSEVVYTLSSKGGNIKSIELKKFKTFFKKPLYVYEGGKNNMNFSFNDGASNQPINTEDLYFNIASKTDKSVSFNIDLGNGRLITKTYALAASGYMSNFTFDLKKFEQVIPRNTSYILLNWNQRMPSQEHSLVDEQRNSSIYYRLADGEVDKLKVGKDEEEKLSAPITWISYKQKFFNTTLIADKEFDRGTKVSTARDKNQQFNLDASSELVIPYNGSADFNYKMQIYAGPNDYKALRKMDNGLHETINLGWSIFGWVNRFLILPVFHFLSKFLSNYGIIILILTILIKLILTPFTYKSQLSAIKMKVLKPELDELKKKFGKDAQKLQMAQMELYRKAGVNPLGGCLPMLLQMPILFAMYRLFPASIELRQQSFLWASDLSSYDDFIKFPKILGMDHLSIFALLMGITSFVSTKMTAQSSPDDDSPMAQQMKLMQYIMPFFLIFIFNSLSSAMSYYYFLFNVLTIIQTWFMKKFMIDEAKIHAEIQVNKTKPVKKSGWAERMEKMVKEQQELQRRKNGK